MYLLSPGGETLFLIPGVEVVHKVPAPINIPEGTKGKITNKVSFCFLYVAFQVTGVHAGRTGQWGRVPGNLEGVTSACPVLVLLG